MSSFGDMTFEEYYAISSQPGFDWRQFYWMGSPKLADLRKKPWRVFDWAFEWIGFHADTTQRDIRKTCKKYGGFDPFYPFNVREV